VREAVTRLFLQQYKANLSGMVEALAAYFEDHTESKDLGRLALRGGIVSVGMQYGNGVLQLFGAVVLARLLAPEDFGLVAMVAVLTSFAPLLVDFGLGDATAQRSKITRSQVSSLFWLSSGIGLAIAVVVFFCSPLIAWIYGEPRLEAIAQCSAITFVLSGTSNQHLALLRRTMQFARIVGIQVFSTLAGIAIAILAAKWGFGYWALVLRQVVTSFCMTIAAWLVCRWRPGFPVIEDEVKSMVRFGLHVMTFTITATVARAVDRIALGLFYRPDKVGYYQSATTLYDNSLFSTLQQLHTVGSAALSKLQSNPAALRQNYEAALSALAFFIMPAAAIISVTAQDLTVVLLGEKWRAAGQLLSIIALRGIPQVVEGSQGWLHLSIGSADRWRKWGIVTLVVQIVTVLGGLPFGAAGVAVAVVVTSSLLAVPAITYAGHQIDIGAALVIRAVGRQLVGAISATVGGWWLQTTVLAHLSSVFRIFSATSFCISIYLIIVVGLFRLTSPIRVAGTVLQDLLRK
jgi:O-antigen/teichoic acid export membrane protein